MHRHLSRPARWYRRWYRRRYRCGLLGAALGLATLSAVAAASPEADNLASLSIEELGNVRVTSVFKRAARLAAMFVIDADDIRRAGAASLREALRLAPHLPVARKSACEYIVSARGFAGSDGNKMPGLIEGRSVYTPLFSGLFWDTLDVALDEIERIEVISGPGGTLWGINAVNGVINVISGSARDSEGGLLSAAAGNRLRDATLRYGGALGAGGACRVYAKAFDERHMEDATGLVPDDAWHKAQFGFRTDWGGDADQFSLLGEVCHTRKGQPLPGSVQVGIPIDLDSITSSGVNLLARWQRTLDAGGKLSVQAYNDRTERDVPPAFAETLDILDFQAQ